MLCYCMLLSCFLSFFIFFFNDTAPTEIYTLFPTRRSSDLSLPSWVVHRIGTVSIAPRRNPISAARSEEHTSELQSRRDLVCRLLLEKHCEDRFLCHGSEGRAPPRRCLGSERECASGRTFFFFNEPATPLSPPPSQRDFLSL